MAEEKLLEFALCGNYGSEFNPYDAVKEVRAQRILLSIHESQKTTTQIADALDLESDLVRRQLSDLCRCDLVAKVNEAEQERYRPNFPIITAADYQKLQPELDKLTKLLVHTTNELLLEIESDLQALQFFKAGYDAPDIPYIVIGGFAFDYGGLAFMKSQDLMTVTKDMPGGRYVFAGFEASISELRKTWMWGHSAQFDKFVFFTHGALPKHGGRNAFPDLFWVWEQHLRDNEKSSVEAKAREIGAILHALLVEPQTIAQLHAHTQQPKFTLIYNLALLEQLEYIGYTKNNNDTHVILKRPVFLSEDIKIIQEISGKFFSRFTENGMMQHYQNLEKVYQQTSPVQHNIDFKETFNMLYHGVFEKATNILIETGKIAKPPLRKDGTHYSPWLVIMEDDTFPNPFA
jgi:predicted transcriptional regulator